MTHGNDRRAKNLRRNQISTWRKTLSEPDGGVGGRRVKRTPQEVELARLHKTNAKLQAELDRTKLALEITGKAHALLEMLSESADSEPRSKP